LTDLGVCSVIIKEALVGVIEGGIIGLYIDEGTFST
jgi:hypothetical protein